MSLRRAIRPLVPDVVVHWYHSKQRSAHERLLQRTCQLLDRTPDVPQWLGEAEFHRLMARYKPFPAYGYDQATLEARGRQRADDLLRAVPGTAPRDFLELACFDGMVAWALTERGHRCHAMDQHDGGFDARAREAGVQFAVMNAMAMHYADDSFDVVYSYNAFEHFADPTQVLHEAIRVTRPGGYIHLHFGPLYGCAKGLHAYKHIPIPYCQYLFHMELMNDHLRGQGKPPIDPMICNGWSAQRFRDLWNSVEDRVERVDYQEFLYLDDLDIVAEYTGCFKGKGLIIDDLVVNIMHVVFRKR